MKTINIVNIKENWIMDKIADEICYIEPEGFKLTRSQVAINDADVNYWVNWKTFRHTFPKTKFDMIFFTHLDGLDWEKIILDKSDLIVCMSEHGKEVLLKEKVPKNKIRICKYFGVSIHKRRKILLGISGRFYSTKRKGEEIILRLARDLDKDIFSFYLKGRGFINIINALEKRGFETLQVNDNTFYDKIDYYLSTSFAEGGNMDVLNALYCGIPIISRNIGFFKQYKTFVDCSYSKYEELLWFLKAIGEAKNFKRCNIMKNQTWLNFRNWHLKLFKEVLNGLANSSRMQSL